uniref:Uncharacterized protein n=1 Tax=Anguilla anguilla TaxID=7936 RepID=A0A0E9Q8H8_ANGAN
MLRPHHAETKKFFKGVLLYTDRFIDIVRFETTGS